MLFSSTVFLFAFLGITLLAYFAIPKRFINAKNIVLLISSLIFYGWGEPKYILIMIFSIFFNYIMAILIERFSDKKQGKRLMLFLCVFGNLCLLGFFKYTDFLIETINNITGSNFDLLKIALPIGISFYTFQTMSYVIDVYRNKVKAQRNLVAFATYVTLFPQLIAGPIVRYSDVQVEILKRNSDANDIAYGIRRFTIGLGKKVILANQIAIIWNYILNGEDLTVLTAWMGAISFTFQIYFDFSGYSDMAIGLGKIFGFTYLENFNYPYISKSVTEFWRRWHMSLSSWFKEYVYVPLGGNRKGVVRQLINIGIVWALTGLWHGASWNFVLWGVYYGIILLLEKMFLLKFISKHKGIGSVYTMVLVIIGWVIFGIDDMPQVLNYIGHMFNFTGALGDDVFVYYLKTRWVLFVMCILASTPLPKYLASKIESKFKTKGIFDALEVIFIVGIFLVSCAFLVSGSYNPFLYFRF